MCIFGGRAFWAEGTANTVSLRQECACTSRKSEGVRGLGQEVRQTGCCWGRAFTGVRVTSRE